MEPQDLDWGSTFERLRDYDTVEDFIGALQTEGVIPVDRNELALSEAMRVLTEAEYIVLKKPEYQELLKAKEKAEKFEKAFKKERAEREMLEKAQEEAERKFEEEKKKYKPVKLRFLVDQPPWYRKGMVIETPDFDWALELITKGMAERVGEVAPPPKPAKPAKPLIEEVEEAVRELEALK
jgi:ribosomal protein L11 methylase PrmA